MGIYVLRRLILLVGVVWAISVLVFAITQVLPGNAARMILGQFATPEAQQALEAKLGLTDPPHVQYLRWFGALLRGDLGTSLAMERPVAPLLFEALGRSAVVALAALFLVAVLGIVGGVLAALRSNGPVDHAVSAFSSLGIAVPEFFWGIVLILVFARHLGWLPSTGYAPWSDGAGVWLRHLILPVLTLTFTLIAHVSRLTRSSMLEVLLSNYIRAARARGLPERTVIFRHALRNALLPTITVLAIDFGWLIGGVVVVETVFAFPGFGQLLIFGVQHRDLPLMQAAIMLVATLYCVANLAADLLYAALNPRIRYAGAS